MSTRAVEVRLQRPSQLFEADPIPPTSPDYTEFTAQPAMDTVRDMLLRRTPRRDTAVELRVILPAEHRREGLAEELTTAVRRWIEVQNRMDADSSEAGGAIGRRLFVIGALAFLLLQTIAIGVRNVGADQDDYLIQALAEGLTVTSWVMLWFPVQLFTMDVWRASLRRRRMRLLESMSVVVLWDDGPRGRPAAREP